MERMKYDVRVMRHKDDLDEWVEGVEADSPTAAIHAAMRKLKIVGPGTGWRGVHAVRIKPGRTWHVQPTRPVGRELALGDTYVVRVVEA